MSWDSPWGEGFPGWHLECSAIIHTTLGDPIDIHTGAVDLIGTHHTNEMAQTEAAFGNQLANYWVHNEYLLVEGQRMAKSKGNFYTLKQVTDEGYSPSALRLLFLQSHYRSQLNFTWGALDAAEALLKEFYSLAVLRWQAKAGVSLRAINSGLISEVQAEIASAMADDLNSPKAIASLSKLIQQRSSGLNTQDLDNFSILIIWLDDLFGLDLAKQSDISQDQKDLLDERQKYRSQNNWHEADKIRSELKLQGIEIDDIPDGQIWRRA